MSGMMRSLAVAACLALTVPAAAQEPGRGRAGGSSPVPRPSPPRKPAAKKEPTTKEPATKQPAKRAAADRARQRRELRRLVEFWLRDLNRFWKAEYRRQRFRGWRDARFVVYERGIETPCGTRRLGQGAMYCTTNNTMYVPIEGARLIGVSGDFAHAFVIAHEMGHHVQLGLHLTSAAAKKHLATNDPKRQQETKIRHELQADCFAGVWMHSLRKRGLLRPGEIEDARATARAIGDDALGNSREIWKHGSSEQRVHWFDAGYRTGRISACKSNAP